MAHLTPQTLKSTFSFDVKEANWWELPVIQCGNNNSSYLWNATLSEGFSIHNTSYRNSPVIRTVVVVSVRQPVHTSLSKKETMQRELFGFMELRELN